MTPVLHLESVTLRHGPVTAVDGVSLLLHRGETLGLIGESGCGKSSVARAIVGLARPESGSIRFEGEDLHRPGQPPRHVAERVQLLFQDPAASLSPRMTVRRLIEEPLRIAGRHTPEGRADLAALAREIGLGPDLMTRYPHQISGGQARRVALLRALAARPAVLIADEPTAGLDLSVQGDLLNLMDRLLKQHGLSYLLISHNLNVVGRVTDRVAVMYLGEIVETGPTAALFAGPAHPYTGALLSANLVVSRRQAAGRVLLKGDVPSPANPPPGCRFHQRCPVVQPLCRTARPSLSPEVAGRSVACHFPLQTP